MLGGEAKFLRLSFSAGHLRVAAAPQDEKRRLAGRRSPPTLRPCYDTLQYFLPRAFEEVASDA
jgi:hypothetical protein